MAGTKVVVGWHWIEGNPWHLLPSLLVAACCCLLLLAVGSAAVTSHRHPSPATCLSWLGKDDDDGTVSERTAASLTEYQRAQLGNK